MGIPVAELMDRIDSQEFSYWQAFYNLEPFGPQQDDLRHGYATSILFNVHRKEKSKALQPGDFFPSLKSDKQKHFDSPQGQADLGRIWAGILNGRHRQA